MRNWCPYRRGVQPVAHRSIVGGHEIGALGATLANSERNVPSIQSIGAAQRPDVAQSRSPNLHAVEQLDQK
jgi:hypothetical protein